MQLAMETHACHYQRPGWEVGGATQVGEHLKAQGPEFNPQYKKKKTRIHH
jgi:hypothetical protein